MNTIKKIEEDEIIKEMDIYVSSKLSKYLKLFQYPIRSDPFTEDTQPITAKIKPNAGSLELVIPINTELATYNKEKGEELGVGLNEQPLKSAENFFQSEATTLYDKQTLSATTTLAATNYAIGIVVDGKLHLTKLNSIAQFGPSFKAIDKIDEKKLQLNKRVEKLTEENKNNNNNGTQAIQLMLKKSDLSGLEESRKTINDVAREVREEPWKELTYFGKNSDASKDAYSKLINENKETLISNMNNYDYINAFSTVEREGKQNE